MNYLDKIDMIFKKHKLGFISQVDRINVGFNNLVFDVNDKYIVKICYNENREQSFKKEVNFYVNSSFDFVPKIVAYNLFKYDFPFLYMIQEKIRGLNLYSAWSDITYENADDILYNLYEIMLLLHNYKTEDLNYNVLIYDKLHKYLDEIRSKQILKESEIFYLEFLNTEIAKNFSPCKTGFIHGDLQFNNVLLLPDKSIKVIDFECCEIAPIEKEFDTLYRMSENPYSFMQSGNRRKLDLDAFAKVKVFFDNNYTDISSKDQYAYNLMVFEIINAAKWINFYPDHNPYRETLINKSKQLIKKIER